MEYLGDKIDLDITCPHCGHEFATVAYPATDSIFCHCCDLTIGVSLYATSIVVEYD